jgi:hypothetical protein
MNKKWLTVAVLVCMLAAAALQGVSSAARFRNLSCALGFDSAHDDTECWWRGLYSIPAAGGSATLLLGAYVENRRFTNDSGSIAGEYRPEGLPDWEDLTLSPGALVTVKIYDYLDRSRVLFSFQGTLAELTTLAGGITAFSGPYGVVVRIPLDVPAGNVVWVGRMELTQGGYRCHADTFLFQGMGFFRPVA